VVDDEFVSAVGTQGGLNCAGDCAAGIDVAEDGAIFGVVAACLLVWSLCSMALAGSLTSGNRA